MRSPASIPARPVRSLRRRQPCRGVARAAHALAARGLAVLTVLTVLAVTVLSWAPLGQAQTCVAPNDAIETTPGSQAVTVALDAPMLVRFPDPVLVGALEPDLIRLVEADIDDGRGGGATDAGVDDDLGGTLVAGQLERLSEFALVFRPDEALVPLTIYRLLVREVGTDRVREVLFQTGRDIDAQPPQIFLSEADVDLRASDAASCGGEPGGFRVELRLPFAVDDADNGGVEYYLYLTRAEGLRAPRLLQRARRQGASSRVRFVFVLSAEEATGPVCAALRVVDAVGKRAQAQPEVCFDPVQEAHFQPLCVAGAGGAGRGRLPDTTAWGVASALFLLACGLRLHRGRTMT